VYDKRVEFPTAGSDEGEANDWDESEGSDDFDDDELLACL
jgi:hypothetical protein